MRHGQSLTDMLWDFVAEDSTGASLRHAAVRLLRPGVEDWDAERPWRRTQAWHYLRRPLRLARKWGRRLAYRPPPIA